MPNSSSRSIRRGVGKLTEKSKSFHGKAPVVPATPTLRRPKTQPDLFSGRSMAGDLSPVGPPRLTKLLLNVTVQRSLGPVQVLLPPESTVGDLVREAVRAYGREARRPLLTTGEPNEFDLHYSQFSLESLNPEEKVIGLGSRNFFLCPKPLASVVATTCSKEVEKASKTGFSLLRFLL